jgi:hypothetical protein
VFYAPNTPLLPLHDPPATGLGRDVPRGHPSPRSSPLRAFAARLTRARPAPTGLAQCRCEGLTPDGDQLAVPP